MNFRPSKRAEWEKRGNPSRYLPGLAEPRRGPDFSEVPRVFLNLRRR